MFELRGSLSKIQNITLGILGAITLIGLWWLLAEMLAIPALDYRAPNLDDPSLQNLNRDSLLLADSIQFANAKTVGKIYKILPTPLHVVQAYPKLLEEDNLPVHTIHSIWLNLKGYFWAILISFDGRLGLDGSGGSGSGLNTSNPFWSPPLFEFFH